MLHEFSLSAFVFLEFHKFSQISFVQRIAFTQIPTKIKLVEPYLLSWLSFLEK